MEAVTHGSMVNRNEAILKELQAVEKKNNKQRGEITFLKQQVKEGKKRNPEKIEQYEKLKKETAELGSENPFAKEALKTIAENMEKFEEE